MSSSLFLIFLLSLFLFHPLSISAQSPTPIIGNGDANGDGKVDMKDILVEIQNYGKNQGIPLDQYQDGLVNTIDFTVVVSSIPGTANILWSSGMENGSLDDWWSPETQANHGCCNLGGEFDSGIGSSLAAKDFAHTGDWSAKMTITTPSGTSEMSGTRLFRWGEPQTHSALYYSVWYYFPQRYSAPNWWNVFQWKSKRSDTINDPFFILNIGNRSDGSMYYYLYDWQKNISYDQSLMNIPVGQWTQVEAFYQCVGDNTGHVTFWQDGKQIFDVSNVQTRYSDGDCQWSVNNYSNLLSPSPATIYIDDAVISTSRIGGVIP